MTLQIYESFIALQNFSLKKLCKAGRMRIKNIERVTMQTLSFLEDHISQIPAVELLVNLGYSYLSPEEALELRGNNTTNVILETVLYEQLQKMNRIYSKGENYPFSNQNITNAVNTIKNIPYDGLVSTNEQVYDLLTLGKSFEENIQGSTKSFTMNYIDWDNIENNVFHVSEEFEVLAADGKHHRRPDLVLFVNGIPLVVIECKRPDHKDPVHEAVSQHIRNQKDEEIPKLFVYSQLLLALSKNENKYATTKTSEPYWSVWKENVDEFVLSKIINLELDNDTKDRLFSNRYNYVRDYFDSIEKAGRQNTEQDRLLYNLCRKERLLELIRKYIVFDAKVKKIARYQQYFAVRKAISRVKGFEKEGNRKGGVIWHTQGSGKSLTMVMIATSLALEESIENPRIIVVSDRIHLDKQIAGTFKKCGMEPTRARTGKHLFGLLEGNKKIIVTTVIDKFETSLRRRNVKIDSPNIFVLIDESHRSQYGTAHALMKKVLPNASYIGFTGTPLLKKDKNTANKFGGFIDKYTIDQAVKDKAVVPLLYEGRHIAQDVQKKQIDRWFGIVSEPLSEYQATDLKRKYSKSDKVNATDQRLNMIAYDISAHFSNNFKDGIQKGQFATASRTDAIKYKNFFDEIGMISTEVIMSPPDTREGHDDVDDESNDEIQKFWSKMMKKYGNEKTYVDTIVNSFQTDESPDIIIVVDMLLTGFDAPRNTVLYIDKNLKEHNLLQAIARVNRLNDGKDFGFIVDYRGILGELDKALSTYRALEEFDQNDIMGTMTNIKEEIDKLPQRHSDLWDIFKGIKNKKDSEEYETLLFDEELRQKFYEKLSLYARNLSVAFSSTKFLEECPTSLMKRYKEDLKAFQELRALVKKRYSETIDFKEYEPRIQKLLNSYVSAEDVFQITEQVNIFDKENFEKEVEKATGKAARADIIAHRTLRTIEEKWEEDPVFYKKFSKLIKQAIKDFREKRLTEAEYFMKSQEYMDSVRDRKEEGLPEILNNRNEAKAFYGVTHEVFKKYEKNQENLSEISAQVGIAIDDIVIKNKVVDWHNKQDIQNRIKNEIEDYLYDLKDQNEVDLTFDDIDEIMEKALKIAMRRYE